MEPNTMTHEQIKFILTQIKKKIIENGLDTEYADKTTIEFNEMLKEMGDIIENN
jgi:hypothetical protein